MFGFNKDNPLGNVTREDFNIYKIELLDRLGLIQKSLNKLIEFRQIEKRQKIEQELEQTNIVRKEIEPEKIKEENEEKKSNPLLTLIAGSLAGFGTGIVQDLLRRFGLIENSVSGEFTSASNNSLRIAQESRNELYSIEDMESDIREENSGFLSGLRNLFSEQQESTRSSSSRQSRSQQSTQQSSQSSGTISRQSQRNSPIRRESGNRRSPGTPQRVQPIAAPTNNNPTNRINRRGGIERQITPEGAALLSAISVPESGGRYDIIVGAGDGGSTLTNEDHMKNREQGVSGSPPAYFSDFSQHPNIRGLRTSRGPSTAAGRYQITNTTWRGLQQRYPNLTDFSPANQDLAAWYLAQEDYNSRTGRSLSDDLRSGRDINSIARNLSGTWTSLEGGVESQDRGSGEAFRTNYETALQQSGSRLEDSSKRNSTVLVDNSSKNITNRESINTPEPTNISLNPRNPNQSLANLNAARRASYARVSVG